MTPNHKHRVIRLKRGGLALRLLQRPIARTVQASRAHASRWVWGEDERGRFTLSTLGVLHTLVGLTVETGDKP